MQLGKVEKFENVAAPATFLYTLGYWFAYIVGWIL